MISLEEKVLGFLNCIISILNLNKIVTITAFEKKKKKKQHHFK